MKKFTDKINESADEKVLTAEQFIELYLGVDSDFVESIKDQMSGLRGFNFDNIPDLMEEYAKYRLKEEETGSRDSSGNWVPETAQAKLRNKLGPFWTLSEILSDDDMFQKLISSNDGVEIVKDLVRICEENKSEIMELISQTQNDK